MGLTAKSKNMKSQKTQHLDKTSWWDDKSCTWIRYFTQMRNFRNVLEMSELTNGFMCILNCKLLRIEKKVISAIDNIIVRFVIY